MSKESKTPATVEIDLTSDWTQELRDPFLVEGDDGCVTFLRDPRDQNEKDLYLRILGRSFVAFFAGNPTKHYTLNSVTKKYVCVERGLTAEDFRRHLAGQEPGVLSIPILPDGKCHFGVADCDRHGENDPPVDPVALAKKVTALGLPLIVCRSKSPKSAHLFLFLKDKEGFSAAVVRRLLKSYVEKLEISGEIEYFPKQDGELKKGQKGSGINCPFFGEQRVAFGKDGEQLDIMGFLQLAQERQSYAQILENRDLTDEPKQDESSGAKDDRPLPVGVIRDLHLKNLASLSESNRAGHWNDNLNVCAFFAARAFAAGALEGTKQSITDGIRKAARAIDGFNQRRMESTLASGWNSGITQPLTILDPQKAHDEALAKIDAWLDDKDAPNPDPQTAYDDLALLDEEEYETRRGPAAKRLGIRPTALDNFVKKRSDKNKQDVEILSGAEIIINDPEVWDQPVDGNETLIQVDTLFRRFIVFKNPTDSKMVSLWALGSFLSVHFNIFPRLGLFSPDSECGKTTVIDLLSHLVCRGLRSDNLTTATCFRAVELFRPTLLLDELDTFLLDNPELIGILNSGHKQGGFVLRMEKSGDKQELRKFSTYGAICYGMIAPPYPPRTLLSRTNQITIERKTAGQKAEDFDLEERPGLADELLVLNRKLKRWSLDHFEDVTNCRPDTSTLANRARNNWRPLLKIATVLGGDWPTAALTAAGVPPVRTRESDAVRLLNDIRTLFNSHTPKVDRAPSTALVGTLNSDYRESGWYRFHNGREPLDEGDVADLLAGFGIGSKAVRLNSTHRAIFKSGKEVVKGYCLKWFDDAFDRYLKPLEAEEPEPAEGQMDLPGTR
jgi:hypothetical protein